MVFNGFQWISIGSPKGIEVRNLFFLGRNIGFLNIPNNLIFGLSEIVEGTFLKIMIFRQNFEFSNFRPDFPLLRSKSLYFELILWISELIPLYFGCLNLYFGHQRTKHSGMTRESGNTEGPSILV